MKKLLSIILALTLLVAMAGCAGAEAFDAKAICEGVTLTLAVPEVPRISDWNENYMTQYIEETLGVNLEFEVYPAADYYSKVNAMVMTGDELPDMLIFPGGDKTNHKNWAAEGALLELSKFYADPNLSANITAAGPGAGYDIGSYLKDGDGNIWGLPSLEQGLGMQSWQRFWIYQPWLDQMGKEAPTTIDEFYEMAKYIAEHDMNGDGDNTNDYVIMGDGFNAASNGWSDWFEPLMSAFVYAWDPNFVTVNDGQVGFAYTTDAWKEGLKYIKKFFDEGLIGTDLFTNTSDDAKAILYSEVPSVFSFTGWAWEGPDQKTKTEWTYTALKGPEGQEGYSQYMPILPSVAGAITVDCENPEAAFLVGDLMCSEYLSLVTRYGEEGLNWAYWDRVVAEDVLKPEEWAAQGGEGYEIEWVSSYADTTFWSSQESTTASWLQKGPFIRTAEMQTVRARQVSASTEEDKMKIYCTDLDIESKFAGIANAAPEVFDYYPLTAEQNEKVLEIQLTANNYVSEMTAAFLTGAKDIDAEWDNFLAQLKVIGLDELQEIYQSAYTLVH